MSSRYTYVWEFTVALEHEMEFETHHGPNGIWSRLFKASSGYIETLLLRDQSVAGRYIPVDRWIDEKAYMCFRSECGQEYAQLDSQCERLTVGEKQLGKFSEPVA